jgi:hypothetical protein
MLSIAGASLAALAVILAAVVAHRLESRRNREQRRHEMRTSRLLDAFIRLEHLQEVGLTSKTDREFSSALRDIQIFGSRSQVALAQQAINGVHRAIEEKRGASGTSRGAIFNIQDLRRSLLSDLRQELLLDPDVPLPIQLSIPWVDDEA